MKKIIQFLIIVFAFNINAKIEVLDRVAVIVDDGVIMESQIDKWKSGICKKI